MIATEGHKTEPIYFQMFSRDERYTIKIIPSRHKSSPVQVFEAALDKARKIQLRACDEVWLVIDRDSWNEEQLAEVCEQCGQQEFCLAVSNPKFEYWLLLHFEDGSNISSAEDCVRRLRKHMPDYHKSSLKLNKLRNGIADAIDRAKSKDSAGRAIPPVAGSTVYRLIERLL